jgi:nuclear pore complex protein Nup107
LEGNARDQRNHSSALALLDELKDLSFSVKSQLEDHSKAGPDALPGPWRERVQSVKDHSQRSSRRFESSLSQAGDGEDLRRASAEYQTWDLLRRVLEIRKPQPSDFPLDNSIQMFLNTRSPPNRQTPPAELWERFLLTDTAAREKKSVIEWLEACAQESDPDVDTIIGELEGGASKRGTWSHGFLYTRERIKNDKRRRGIGTFLGSSTLRNSENTEPLVTQLDPDAPTRQARGLEKKDDYYDRTLWLACFAMVRRGTSWKEIRHWCEERREGWRAASFGMATDHQESKTGLAGPQAGALWRQMCLAAARNAAFDPYQRAVYGLLAGDVRSVDPVCRSFDDLLYCRYNALLIRSFEAYLNTTFPGRFPSINETHRFPELALAVPEEDLAMSSADYVFKVATNPICAHEASDPYKILQESIIGDDFQRLITHLGVIIAHRANAERPSRLFPPLDKLTASDRYACLADDMDVIRLVVHMYAIYLCIGYEFPQQFRMNAIEHVIVAYMDHLRLQGKLEVIPLYSTLLSEERRWQALGVVLVDVKSRKEQEGLVQLLVQQEADLPEIIMHQYLHAASLMGFLQDDWRPVAAVPLLEATDDHQWPGFRVKRDFRFETKLAMEEERLARAVEWYVYVDAAWEQCFRGLSFALRSFLLSGNVGGAVAIAKRVPYRLISLKKSAAYLSRSVDVFGDEAEQGAEPLRRSTRARSGQRPMGEEERFTLEMLRRQARPYRDMQRLCGALEQLALWNEFLRLVREGKVARPELDEMMRDSASAVEPLLDGFMADLPDSESPLE